MVAQEPRAYPDESEPYRATNTSNGFSCLVIRPSGVRRLSEMLVAEELRPTLFGERP